MASKTAPASTPKVEVINALVSAVSDKTGKDWFAKTHHTIIKPEETRQGVKLYMEWKDFDPVATEDTVVIKERVHRIGINVELEGEWPEKRQALLATEVTRVILDKAKNYQRERKGVTGANEAH